MEQSSNYLRQHLLPTNLPKTNKINAKLLLIKVPRKFFPISLKAKKELGRAGGRQRQKRMLNMWKFARSLQEIMIDL
jgi:hypothetical protein